MLKLQLTNIVLVILFSFGTLVFAQGDTGAVESNGSQFEPLILNRLYTQWCLEIAGNMTVDAPCITPHGSETTFTTDANGNVSITMETSTLPSDSLFEVAIAYHSDGQDDDNYEKYMPIWFGFRPTNNVIVAVEPTNMLAKHNDEIAASGTFQRQSLTTTGSGRYTVDGNQATLELIFERLVPDAEYTLWCVAITASTNQQITERPCT